MGCSGGQLPLGNVDPPCTCASVGRRGFPLQSRMAAGKCWTRARLKKASVWVAYPPGPVQKLVSALPVEKEDGYPAARRASGVLQWPVMGRDRCSRGAPCAEDAPAG